MAVYLGFDSSTQSLTVIAIAVHADDHEVLLERSLSFDDTLPHYGTRHGVLPSTDPRVVHAPPLMWAEALDLMMADLARSGIALADVRAVSGAAQQHGSVYLAHGAASRLGALDASAAARRPAAGRLGPRHRAGVAGLEHAGGMRSHHRGRGRRPGPGASHRFAGVRAIHGSADSRVRRAAAGGLRDDGEGAPGQLVSWPRCSPARMRRSILATPRA